MGKSHTLGKWGEQMAAYFLLKKGYTIIDYNFKSSFAEIDLIVWKNPQLVFVEVKTLNKNNLGYPEDQVNFKKEQKIITLASDFIDTFGHTGEIRFDILSITIKPKRTILHFEDAFFPIW